MSENLLNQAAAAVNRLRELTDEINNGAGVSASLEVLSKTKELHRIALELQDELMGRLFRKEVI